MVGRNLLEYARLSPDQLYGELFRRVQCERIFSDTKTFVDSIPRISPEEILHVYEKSKTNVNFDLREFVHQYFEIPPWKSFASDRRKSVVDHVNGLWEELIRPGDRSSDQSSRLRLPYPFVVPGGRFREIFYWDTYFTMLGLSVDVKYHSLMENLLDNFSYLIDEYGLIPNGTRTYFLSRSQPPFFALMIDLFSQCSSVDASTVRRKYFPFLLREYQFWTGGKDQLSETNPFHQVRLSSLFSRLVR